MPPWPPTARASFRAEGWNVIVKRVQVQVLTNLVEPLVLIFNRSLQEGCFPTKWKTSFIIPLHKGGDRRNVKNYRPISKLSVLGKKIKKIILDSVENNIVTQQHGFFSCRSVDTNLIGFTDFLSRWMIERRWMWFIPTSVRHLIKLAILC